MNFRNNVLVKYFYSLLFYLELGRGTASRFYGWIPEMIILIGGLKYLLGIELTPKIILLALFLMASLMTLGGYFIKKTGLYDVDRYVQANKDPVTKEILDKIRKIK